MKKEVLIIVIVSVLLVASGYYAFTLYGQNKELNIKSSELSEEKNQAVADMEQCRTDKQKVYSELDMLKDDLLQLEKSCITDNACKGHFPNIRWNCNNVGDLADESTASHICVCDSSCILKTTPIAG